MHLRLVQSVLGRSSGVEWLDAITNTHDLFWNVRALRKAKRIDSSVLHFDLALLDKLFDTCSRLGIQDKVQGIAQHRRTRRSVRPVVQYGSYYGLKAAEEQLQAALTLDTAAPAGGTNAKPATSFDLNRLLQSKGRKIHFVPDPEDVQIMLSDKRYLTDSGLLEDALLKNGLVMTLNGGASKYLEELLAKEAAYVQIRELQVPAMRARLQQEDQQGP